MESLATLQHRHNPFHFSVSHRLPSFPNPISSLSFRNPSPSPSLFRSPSSFKSLSIKSSSFNQFLEASRNPNSSTSDSRRDGGVFSEILKTACISIAATAFFFLRFNHRQAIAAPIAPETTEYKEKENVVEEESTNDLNDAESLRSLIEANVKSGKLPEAIETLNRLIELEPDDGELPMLRANFHSYMGEIELARNEFEEILAKEPFRVEAYHGLAMVADQLNDNSLKDVLKRIEEAVEKCKKLNKKSDMRDFKLLIAQIKVMEGSYFDALKDYQELVKEEPRDFRPYLCQGIIFTLLKKNDEAEKQFEKFRKLVPKNHPYKEYFDDNMFATKLFSQKVEKEGAGLKS